MKTNLTVLVLVVCIAVRATAFDDSEEPAVRDSLNALMRTGHWSRTVVMADSAVLIARGHAWAPGSRIVMTWEPETGCLLVEGVTLLHP